MYYVECQLSDGSTPLLHNPHSTNVKLYSGKLTLVLNAVSDFSFSILPDHPLFPAEEPLRPYVTLVRVSDEKGNYIFRGRIIDYSYKMGTDGLILKEYIAEDELAYLIDSMQRHGEYHNIAPADYLNVMLDFHNEYVGADSQVDKRIYLGTVDVTDPNDEIYRYLSYDTTLKNIQDDLIGPLGGYISIQHSGGVTDDVKYLNYLTESGTTSEMSIELAVNLRSIESQVSPSEMITRLIPLGANYESVPLAINRLFLAGLLVLPDYWLEAYPKLGWLGQLLINLSRLVYDFSTSNGITTVAAAIPFLAAAGAISSPEYWLQNYAAVGNLDLLLIRAANYADASSTALFADAAVPRLTIASVNNRLDYIDYDAGIANFGIIEGVVIWDDVTKAKNLLANGRAWLESQTITNSVTIGALDLSLINESFESFKVGNYYRAHNELLGIDAEYHLIEQNIDILSPSEGTLTFGNRPMKLSLR